jgi:DNA modification methylase
VPIDALKPRARNPRIHSEKQVRQIARSIEQFGFTNPALVDLNNGIIAGHARVQAAKLLGWTKVPAIRLEDLSEAEVRAYVIADNRLNELSGWDDKILPEELKELIDLDIDFDPTVTGFEMPEIDILIDQPDAPKDNADDRVPALPKGPPVCRPGDLWAIGNHRLLCGDATEYRSYDELMLGERAQMVFTDPPYNVPVKGHVSGLGKVKHAEFAMASGEMSPKEFISFLSDVFNNLVHASADGSMHFVCMDWRHIMEVLKAGHLNYREFKNLCVWVKSNGGMGSLYRSQHELVFVFKAGEAPHINNVELGRHGRYRTNVWHAAGANSFGKNRNKRLAEHPTVKPVGLVAEAILDCSHRGGLILDPFAGSGSTLVAAHRTGRRGFGIELDPAYCDVTLKRVSEAAGCEPVLLPLGETFSEVAKEREAESRKAPSVGAEGDHVA